MADRLRGSIAVVTGGGAHTDRIHGIGEDTCQLFAEEGASVVVVDREETMVKRTVNAIKDNGGPEPLGVTADLTNLDDLERLARTIDSTYGTLDCVVNNAAIRTSGPVTEATREEWNNIFAVNLRSLGEVSKVLVPLMAESGGGTIVNVSSSNAHLARSGMAQYDAMKSGVLGLTRSMACDHAPQSIRVNAILPGSVVTDYQIEGSDIENPEEYVQEKTTRRPEGPGILKRNSHPREIAYGILFLASEESSFVTGSCIDINGGKTAAGYTVNY